VFELTTLDSLPSSFYEDSLEEFLAEFENPVIFNLDGEISDQPIFISTLLHGNELSGIIALRRYFKKFKGQLLPRKVILLLGNIEATKKHIRKHDDEPDYNRIWNSNGKTGYHQKAREILDFVKKANPLLCLDLHNNTGKNPMYACINKLEMDHVYLAKLFAETVVYFTEPSEVMSVNCAKFAPSLTIEAGISENEEGILKLIGFFEKVFSLTCLKNFEEKQFEIFHTFAKIKVSKSSTVSFHDRECDLVFRADLDEFNFLKQPPGMVLGNYKDNKSGIIIIDSNGSDITDLFIKYDDNEIVLKREFIPSMFTKNVKVIHQDCLGYLMEKCTVLKE